MRTGVWRSRGGHGGYSLAELLVVVGVTTVLAAITVFGASHALEYLRGENGLTLLESQLRFARSLAINQRRLTEVVFISPNEIRIMRHDLPEGSTLVSQVFFEGNIGYMNFPGLPDTPDGFGVGAPVNFGASSRVGFAADGMLVDVTGPSAAGAPVNGTVFLGRTGADETAWAVTVFGRTGHVRGYRWDGTAWIES